MGTRGLEIVRFRGRYYIQYHQYDSYYEGLGKSIVGEIPQDPGAYQSMAVRWTIKYPLKKRCQYHEMLTIRLGWLQKMRTVYARRQKELEENFDMVRDEPKTEVYDDRGPPPSALPWLDDTFIEYVYIINLDREVLTVDFGIHYKLSNIPQKDDLWLRAISFSVYSEAPTISNICPEEHMASPAVELREPKGEIAFASGIVTPKTGIGELHKVLVTRVLAAVFVTYKKEIKRFAREWSPDSFPFRELAFALISIASGQAKFHSFPELKCPPGERRTGCPSADYPIIEGWLSKEWVGDEAPLLEFGTMAHLPGNPPGASPTETIYWHEGVLVSLELVVDGEAISKAVAWGIEHGRINFQLVVLSIFEVAFAEVSTDQSGVPFVKATKALHLSPLHPDYCLSTHPRERPAWKNGTMFIRHPGEVLIESPNCTGTVRKLRRNFPGLAALANFFDMAASRRAASKTVGDLPTEVYDRIIDFVDYETWRQCLLVSQEFRSSCLRKPRLDNRQRIVKGPFVRLQMGRKREEPMRLLSFDFENLETGKIRPRIQARPMNTQRCRYMPVIGSDRKAIMLEVWVQYEPVMRGDPETDSEDEGPAQGDGDPLEGGPEH